MIMGKHVAVDWGSSKLPAPGLFAADRSWRGRGRWPRTGGILQVVRGGIRNRPFATGLGDWLQYTDRVVLAGPMVTSRNGWVETPYLACPGRP